jgi:hypothetical protein
MTETRIHPITGKPLTRQTRRQAVTFGSLATQVDVPGWGHHRVHLLAKPSIAYAKLQLLHDKLIAQPDFARAIKELARFATTPAAADMLELIHAGGLIPATDDPALIDRCVEVADRLTHATAPATLQTIINLVKD